MRVTAAALPFLLLIPLVLQACASGGEVPPARTPDVVRAYEDPLVRGKVLDEKDSTDLAASGAPAEDEVRLPELKPGETPDLASDEGGLWMRSDRWEERQRSLGEVIVDPELQRYLREVVCRVARDYCNDVRVYVVSRPGFNASMAPNGFMVIWSGALLRIRSEAELAAIIGHELGHYLRRHTLQKVRSTRSKVATFLEGHGGTVTARAGFFSLLEELSGFSQTNEREADGYSLRLLAESGYEPNAVPRLWSRLSREFEVMEAYRDRSIFYASHPLLGERSQVLSGLAGKVRRTMTGTPFEGREAFLAKTLPHRFAFLRDELDEGRFFQVKLVLDDLLGDEDPNPAELHFFMGEVYRLRNDAGDDARALRRYDTAAVSEGKAPPELFRSRGLLLNRMQRRAEAAGAFKAYLATLPAAPDRALIEAMIADLESR